MDIVSASAFSAVPFPDQSKPSPSSSPAFLAHKLCAPNPTWETELDAASLSFLADHRVNGAAVFPGAGYIDAIVTARGMLTRRTAVVAEDIEFRKMLRIDGRTLRLEITGRNDLALYSRGNDDSAWTLHAKAGLSGATPATTVAPLDLAKVLERCNESADPELLYQRLSAGGLQYGPCFQTIRRVWRNSGEVVAEIEAHPAIADSFERHLVHPTLLDGAFQSLAALLPPDDCTAPYVPVRIDRILFNARPPARVWGHCRLRSMSGQAIEADLVICDDLGVVQAEIRGLRCQRLAAAGPRGRLDRGGHACSPSRRSMPHMQPLVAAAPAPVSDEAQTMEVRRGAPQAGALPCGVPLALSVSPQRSLWGLAFRETERRPPRQGEVELQINAAALNFKDVLKMTGRLSVGVTNDTFFGTDIGMEAAATVVRVGDGVDSLRVGDRIVVMAKGGCFRSFLTVATSDLFWLPELAGYRQADLVALPIVFATALHSLRDVARLTAGERVLLHSAAGGVGLAAIQVARHLGAEIFATAGSPDKRDYLRSVGIRHVMDSRSLNFADEIMAATGGRGIDVVLNFLAGEALEKSLSVLAPFGRLVEIGKLDIEENNRLPLRAFNRGLSFSAIDLDRLAAARPNVLRALLHEIWDRVCEGTFAPIPVQVFSAADLAEACRFMLKARHIGKVIVQFGDQGAGSVARLPVSCDAP